MFLLCEAMFFMKPNTFLSMNYSLSGVRRKDMAWQWIKIRSLREKRRDILIKRSTWQTEAWDIFEITRMYERKWQRKISGRWSCNLFTEESRCRKFCRWCELHKDFFFLFRRTSSYKIKKNKNKNKEQDCKRFSKSFSPCLGSCISKTQRRFSYNISISLVIIFGSNPDGSAWSGAW